jgi:CheY-like chemotaxis protein
MKSDPELPGDPPAYQTQPEGAAHGLASAGTGGPVQSSAHILLVDDEPINVKIIQKFLGAGGYNRFSSAESGQQALDLLGREMPDLVLLDIFLGDINGIEVLKRLRTLPGGSQLPVLVLTASDDPDLKRVALDLGAVGFVTKPIHQAELVDWLQRTLPPGM